MPKIRADGRVTHAALDAPEPGEDPVEQLRGGEVYRLDYFIDWLAARGLLKQGTANSYQTASNQILAAGDVDPFSSVLDLDVDEVCREFDQGREDLTQTTRTSYQTRFRRALDMYRQWLSDPDTVQPPATRRHPVEMGFGGGKSSSNLEAARAALRWLDSGPLDPVRVAAVQALLATHELGVGLDPPERVVYPFPLSDGEFAQLELPRQISRADAARLSQFVLALATDLPDEAEPSPGKNWNPPTFFQFPKGYLEGVMAHRDPQEEASEADEVDVPRS